MSIDITFAKNHLRVQGMNFFTKNASSIELGSWGEKKDPLTQANYLLLEGRVPAGKLKIRKSLDLRIDSATLTEANLGAGLTVPGMGKLNAGLAADRLRTEQVRLVKLEVLPADLVDAANASPKVIEGFQRVGNDARLVHQIIVALDAKTADLFERSASLTAEVKNDKFSVTAGAGVGSSGGTTVSLENATVGYYLLKITKWDANQKKNWSRMLDWDDDGWSLN